MLFVASWGASIVCGSAGVEIQTSGKYSTEYLVLHQGGTTLLDFLYFFFSNFRPRFGDMVPPPWAHGQPTPAPSPMKLRSKMKEGSSDLGVRLMVFAAFTLG